MNYVKNMMIFLSFSFVGCSVKIPNIELCGKLSQGAHCNYTLEDKAREMNDNEWNEIGRVSMSIEHYGELLKYIKDSCMRSKKCKLENKDLIKIHVFNEEVGL